MSAPVGIIAARTRGYLVQGAHDDAPVQKSIGESFSEDNHRALTECPVLIWEQLSEVLALFQKLLAAGDCTPHAANFFGTDIGDHQSRSIWRSWRRSSRRSQSWMT